MCSIESDEEGRRDAQHQHNTTMDLLESRVEVTNLLEAHPYDLFLYIKRAIVHSDLGYPDLAAGDAYRALLLTDEVRDEGFEYHEVASEALERYLEEPKSLLDLFSSDTQKYMVETLTAVGKMDQAKLLELAAIRCYRTLSISLLLCGCLKSAWSFTIKGLDAAPGDQEILQAQGYISSLAQRRLKSDNIDPSDFPDRGLVRRETYPWNDHEPNRYSAETLYFLNAELANVAPKAEAKVVELPTLLNGIPEMDKDGNIPTNKQLGLFAKEDIAPGETVLDEVSVLCANNRFHNPLCDCCSSELPALGDKNAQAVECEECRETVFCSQECHDLAQQTYHPAVCDKAVESIAKNCERNEIPDMLYLLLLMRSFAMATTQELHPLDLKEVKYIWGDFLESSKNAVPLSPKAGPPPIWTLPFSFKANIITPLHVLEKMDIDIFAEADKYDLWVFNTLYAKFRGTASSRHSRVDGRPEVAAVHPLWCLANHDCDPNVQWEWGGKMRLWARNTKVGSKAAGITKGEEILNHYTDIDLPVRERREWAEGSLGGFCMCERCRTEAAHEDNQDVVLPNGVA